MRHERLKVRVAAYGFRTAPCPSAWKCVNLWHYFKKNIYTHVKVCAYVCANVCVSIQAGGGGVAPVGRGECGTVVRHTPLVKTPPMGPGQLWPTYTASLAMTSVMTYPQTHMNSPFPAILATVSGQAVSGCQEWSVSLETDRNKIFTFIFHARSTTRRALQPFILISFMQATLSALIYSDRVACMHVWIELVYLKGDCHCLCLIGNKHSYAQKEATTEIVCL